MPSIVINEKDLTRGGGDVTATDVVLIPGFMNPDFSDKVAWPDDAKDAAVAGEPVYCDSIAKFERCFGAVPPVYSETETLEEIGVSAAVAAYNANEAYVEGEPEKSYLYAKELLAQGLPVMYVSVNDKDTEGTDIKASDMYTFLSSGIYNTLRDKSEYDIKFVTSGGYPTLEVCGPIYEIAADVDRSEALTFGADAFKAKVATLAAGTYKIRCTNVNRTKRTTSVKLEIEPPSGTNLTIDDTGIFVYAAGYEPVVGDTIEVVTTTTDVSSYTVHPVNLRVVISEGNWEDYYKAVVGAEMKDTLSEYMDKTGKSLEGLTDEFGRKAVLEGSKWLVEADAVNETMVSLFDCDVKVVDDKGVEAVLPSGAEVNLVFTSRTSQLGGGIVSKMISLAANRGDCVALIDHLNIPTRPLVGSRAVYDVFKNLGKNEADAEYAAAFTPWVNANCVTLKGRNTTYSMPPSFAYLMALANSNKTNANWVAIAGATRGQVPNINADAPLAISRRLTNSIAENEYQNRNSVSINAITNINPFGYRIWGNRTLKDNSIEGNLTATSFLNVRNMVSDVKKVAYRTCKKYMFEQNNDVLWANFKADIELTLNKMKTGAGISSYKIIKGTTTEKAKLVATIRLFPIYAVEDFDITVTMEDEEISLS